MRKETGNTKYNSIGSENVKPTLGNVAEKAGVKISSASEILNKRKNSWASEETKKRVFDAARELGYRPNSTARSLRIGKTGTIGAIITAHHFSGKIAGLEQAAYADKYAVITAFNPNEPQTEDDLILMHLDRGVEGLIIYPSDKAPHNELKKLILQGFPIVTFDGAGRLDFDCDDVSANYEEVGQIQARHALEINRKSVCIIRTEPSAIVNNIRESGICVELDANGVTPLMLTLKYNTTKEIQDPEIIYEQIDDFIKKHKGEFDSVIAVDFIAAITARSLFNRGISIPDDVAVIGGGNSILSSHCMLPLTSVDTSDEWIGMKSFQLIAERINKRVPAGTYRRLFSETKLTVRQSTVKNTKLEIYPKPTR